MSMRRAAAAAFITAAVVASCYKAGGSAQPRADLTKPAGPPRLDATLTLPQGDGRVHVIAIPSEFGEVTRCVVAVSSVGMIAASCAPKEIELPAVEN